MFTTAGAVFLTSGATYNQIIAALNPRTLQVGLRVTF